MNDGRPLLMEYTALDWKEICCLRPAVIHIWGQTRNRVALVLNGTLRNIHEDKIADSLNYQVSRCCFITHDK